MSHEARREAALRVARDHRPLSEIFADLRGEAPAPVPVEAAPVPEPVEMIAEPVVVTEPFVSVVYADSGSSVVSFGGPAPSEPAASEPEPDLVGAAEAIDLALRRAVAALAPGEDPDEVAYDLAMAIEPELAGAAAEGAGRAYDAGVPVTNGPGDAGLDIAPETLGPFAAVVVADGPHAAARLVRDTAHRLADRAAVAGMAAVTRAAEGWTVVQRFGTPYCPAVACFGYDGREVPASAGVPPYAEDCNCRLEPVHVGG